MNAFTDYITHQELLYCTSARMDLHFYPILLRTLIVMVKIHCGWGCVSGSWGPHVLLNTTPYEANQVSHQCLC